MALVQSTNNNGNPSGHTFQHLPLTINIRVRDKSQMRLVEVSKSSDRFNEMKDHFEWTWEHTGKSAKVTAFYQLRPEHMGKLLKMVAKQDDGTKNYTMTEHDAASGSIYYHGTQRACRLGEDTDEPCKNDDCHLCSILRKSFRLKHASQTAMFGPGIYSTPTASKADSYAKNHHIRSHQHAILVCSVVKKKKQFLYSADTARTGPDPGYGSVEGALRKDGGAINYREIVVYREDAIIPRAVIMYTRKGWSG